METMVEKMLQMGLRLKSAVQPVTEKVLARLGKLRHAVLGDAAPPPVVPEKPGRWWPFRLRPKPDATPAVAATQPAAESRRTLSQRVARIALLAVLAFIGLPYILVLLYAIIDPPFSALMARQAITGTSIRHKWVDFDNISPHLVRAVLLAEDASFCRHHGVDWSAIGEALEAAEDGETPRGASTIPMQTAKNLFLWNNQDYLRKGLELPLAYYMSLVLSKRRVAELYLNVAEWGPGIFGAEAASRYHFGKSAAALTPMEASLLAAALPSPLKRRAGRPSARLMRIANHIDERADREARDVACVFR